ncbi:MAG: TIGR02452 family protein [Lachnospiraceae bacterium]|nr:TIGR02452 family protein [Lachnospiraceae bacterium]
MTDRYRNIEIAKENKEIVKQNGYEYYDEGFVEFNHSLEEHQMVEVISPEMIEQYAESMDNEELFNRLLSDRCNIKVVNASSFTIASELVLNFSNAIRPGGGYLHGAEAQEEMLCRQSTLYASIGSKEANQMYEYNRLNRNPLESDYMLLSPCVEVFRDEELEPLEEPSIFAVLTSPAPNLNGPAGRADSEAIKAAMINRIRGMLYVAASCGYRRLTLGAWGCGAFGHNAYDVAGYFKEVLVEERMACLFERIVFAVYDNTPRRYNYIAFDRTFNDSQNVLRKKTVTSNLLMPCLRLKQNKAKIGNDMGYIQGIMANGVPFIAEKYFMDGTDSTEIHVIIPMEAISLFDRENCTKEYDEDNLKYNWRSAVCRDLSDKREITDGTVIEDVLQLLYQNQIIARSENESCYGAVGRDKNGMDVIVIGVYLNDNEKIYTKTLIPFQPFTEEIDEQ